VARFTIAGGILPLHSEYTYEELESLAGIGGCAKPNPTHCDLLPLPLLGLNRNALQHVASEVKHHRVGYEAETKLPYC
jgi:hypothetical protein